MGVLVVHMQGFEVVGDRAEPGLHLLGFGAGEKADFLIQPLHAAGGNNPAITLADHSLFDGRRQGQNSFTGAGRAGQVDQVDVRIKQGKQRQ